MSKRPDVNLTTGQLQIMNLFWEQGELGVAQVWKLLSDRRPVARNTVQTMLTRLAERGWLRARAEANAFYYRAARPRKFAQSGMAGELLDSAFGGSASRLLMTLLESRRVSPEEARRIQELIDQARREER
jgi:BlaI family transcriptional regulator, penicillinase repressor